MKDECSFVSLRDVVRAMILFEWFMEKLTTVECLQEQLREKEEEEKRRLDKQIKVYTCVTDIEAAHHNI